MTDTRFEFVSKYNSCGLALPERKTQYSAGYDLAAAQDIIIPSYLKLIGKLEDELGLRNWGMLPTTLTLEQLGKITKETGIKPTLVSTGLKCYLQDDEYLELSVRSSTPLKYWLILANGVGIIDSDYVDNPENEGEIFLQMINLGPVDIQIKKGDIIGQGIIKPYFITNYDKASGLRTGGFGSTSKENQNNNEIVYHIKNGEIIESVKLCQAVGELGVSAEQAGLTLKEMFAKAL